MRILVVDDYVDGADSLVLLLRLWGFEAVAVYNGPAALERARVFHPAVVLSEMLLPHMDGKELARHLLQEEPRVVLIALTSQGREADRLHSQQAGFHFHILKPADPDDLRERLLTFTPQPLPGPGEGQPSPA
jgi:CheY-like chemotaxis protein